MFQSLRTIKQTINKFSIWLIQCTLIETIFDLWTKNHKNVKHAPNGVTFSFIVLMGKPNIQS